MSKGYQKYFGKKAMWFGVTLVAAVALNFFLPRLMPGDPVTAMMGKLMTPGVDPQMAERMIKHLREVFGVDKPLLTQFFIYIGNLFKGDLGLSFVNYPRPVADILDKALPWTIALQLPGIIVGWLLGNILGAVAAYIRKGFDKVMMPVSLFISGIPAFAMAIILLSVFAANLKWFPTAGGYPPTMIPNWSWDFVWGVIKHYQLPFWSIVLIAIGGQAIGMRSMSIYELNADYVKYSRYMGVKDRKIVGYVFRNAMLPQVTGLALQIGTIIGGALVAEVIFGYPGLGTMLLRAVKESDYPLISASTLIITIMVLITVFLLDIIYGLIDPRIKASQYE